MHILYVNIVLRIWSLCVGENPPPPCTLAPNCQRSVRGFTHRIPLPGPSYIFEMHCSRLNNTAPTIMLMHLSRAFYIINIFHRIFSCLLHCIVCVICLQLWLFAFGFYCRFVSICATTSVCTE